VGNKVGCGAVQKGLANDNGRMAKYKQELIV
jgi:hypothetical protein